MKTIMVVDDELDFLEKIKLYLEKEDVEVITAFNSRQAIEQIEEKHENIVDLILINTRLPGSKNSTALFSMKPSSRESTIDNDNFLQKPFTQQQLIEFIKENINKK